MARRCGCASNVCACTIIASTNGSVTVTGSGSVNDPFVIDMGPALATEVANQLALLLPPAVAAELAATLQAALDAADVVDDAELAAAVAAALAAEMVAAGLTGILDPWTSYTPTLVNGTIGNGNLSGRYKQIGKTVWWWAGMTYGSTTSFAVSAGPPAIVAGGPGLLLPFWPMVLPIVDTTAKLRDTSTGLTYAWGAIFEGSGFPAPFALRPVSATGTVISPTVPFTWAVGDSFNVSGVGELP